MNSNRLNLHKALVEALGNNNVYFQPPSVLKYPCIIYSLNNHVFNPADDAKYTHSIRYTVILIGKNPDNETTVNKLLAIPYSSFNRRYVAENLYHDVFDIYVNGGNV